MIEGYTNRIYANIRIEPKPTPRPRLGRGGNVYNEDWYIHYRNAIGKQACRQMGGVYIETPCAVEIICFKNKRPDTRTFGDADNLAKGVLDSLIGVVLADDSLVTELRFKKCQSADPNVQGFGIHIYY